jgi:S1-C subfamily serine protease
LPKVENHIRHYIIDDRTTAFALGGTLRQLTELWTLGAQDERRRGIVQILRAALMQKQGAALNLTPSQVKAWQTEQEPDRAQLERILGDEGPKTYKWWLTGLKRATAVAAIWRIDGERFGSGFLVRGSDFDAELGDELCVLTNAHVVSSESGNGGENPTEVEIRFEADDMGKRYPIREIWWSSPSHLLDASLLRLDEPPTGIDPLRLSPNLPLADGKQQVYLIGHPDGGELSFSWQDNLLLDHEGPPGGSPPQPGRRRLQYSAPSERGSSGSPVFNGTSWSVIALHHAGDTKMPRLNGQSGCWPANEGIWIQSIVEAARQRMEIVE